MSTPNETIIPVTNESNRDSILDELNEPDVAEVDQDNDKENDLVLPKEEIEVEEDEDEKEESKEDDELEKLEKDLEDEDKVKDIKEDEDLLEELVSPVKRSEILAKYPKLFKDFPYLEKAYFRHLQFTELYSTPKDAKVAKEKSDAFDHFDAVLMNGDITQVLQAVKQANDTSFKKIADELLYSLGKVDPTAASHVTGNIIKYTVKAMIKEADTSGDESLRAAASLVNKFIFGSSDIKEPTRLTPETKQEDPKELELKQREQQFEQRRYTEAVTNVGTKIENRIKATIDANIDTKEVMSEYVRSKAAEDVYKKVSELLAGDKQFQTVKDKLWQRAHQNGYNEESLKAIQAAFTSRAKTLLPAVIKKAKIEALRGMGKRVRETDSDKSPVKPGKSISPTSRSNNTKEVPRGMSTLDFLNQD